MNWIKTGTGLFASYTLDCDHVRVQIFPPACKEGSYVAYINDRLLCNVFKTFDETENEVRRELDLILDALNRLFDRDEP